MRRLYLQPNFTLVQKLHVHEYMYQWLVDTLIKSTNLTLWFLKFCIISSFSLRLKQMVKFDFQTLYSETSSCLRYIRVTSGTNLQVILNFMIPPTCVSRVCQLTHYRHITDTCICKTNHRFHKRRTECCEAWNLHIYVTITSKKIT